MSKQRADTHKYTTEAETLPIDVLEGIWLVKYGNEPVRTDALAIQDPFTWECGNRLYWAGLLQENPPDFDTFTQSYTLLPSCKS